MSMDNFSENIFHGREKSEARFFQEEAVSSVVRVLLSPMQLKVWTMRKDGYSHREIAGVLGIKEMVSRKYVVLANQKIRKAAIEIKN